MKIRQFSRKSIVFLFMIAVFFCGVHSLSFGNIELIVSDPASLTEATLHGSVVTLTVQGTTFSDISEIRVEVSGVEGLTKTVSADFTAGDVERLSDTEIRVTVEFDGNFNRDGSLNFMVHAGGFEHRTVYRRAKIPVIATVESLTATSTPASLTEATLDGSSVILTLQGRTFEDNIGRSDVSVSGISGVGAGEVKRLSDTEIRVRLEFDGDIRNRETLTFKIASSSIKSYSGPKRYGVRNTIYLTAEISVEAIAESLTASTSVRLTEATLHGSVVTLSLQGRTFEDDINTIRRNLSVSANLGYPVYDISGLSFHASEVKRTSDTEITVPLEFNGDFDSDAPLTFTVRSGGIKNYTGSDLTAEISVTATTESLTATPASLTEATLHNSTVTLTLQGRTFENDIRQYNLSISGVSGVSLASNSLKRVSDTQITVRLEFNGALNRDATLTFRVRSASIKNYNDDLTAEVRVTTATEALTATSTPTPLTEATLHNSLVTLTLQGRTFENNIGRNLSVSGISGVTVGNIQRVSDTQITVPLQFNGNFDRDRTLTFTIRNRGIKNYTGSDLTAEILVPATTESLTATPASLTEATLHNSTVTLTLQGRTFENNIRSYVSVSGISGVSLQSNNIQRINDTQITVSLQFSGNLDRDGTLTFQVNQAGIKNYNGSTLTATLTVSVGAAESLTATTPTPLTEATLSNSTVTLTLWGRTFENNIGRNLSVSGISGVTVGNIQRVSDTQVTVHLDFTGNFDRDGTLTFRVNQGGIKNYTGSDFTAQLLVTAAVESLTATSTPAPLTGATLHNSTVTLTLRGRTFEDSVGRYLSVSGISGVRSGNVRLLSNTETEVTLQFNGDFDRDGTLTFRVSSGGIKNYTGPELTATLSVSARVETQPPVVVEEPPVNTTPTVNIPDPNLRARIETALGKSAGATITTADMESLISLNAYSANISNLTGLEYATNLKWLYLAENNISNISAVTGLVKLIQLRLYDNNISDIPAVVGLTNLTELSLGGNNISDISAVAGLTNLTELFLWDNNISDISPVNGLTNLTFLHLGGGNNISDISAVVGLTNLTTLNLAENNISDISPVNGLTNLTELALKDNNISDISAVPRLTNLTYLWLGGNNITDLSPLVSNTGLGGGDAVDVRANPLSSLSINTHIPTLQRRGVTVSFDAVVAQPVNIPDPNLRARIETALGKASGAAITTADMESLISLNAYSANISNLTGLEYATNLKWLYLAENNISNISAVRGLTKLIELRLYDNNISDISAVAGLTNLTELSLGGNNISDISVVRGLTNLTELYLYDNNISDISAVRGLTNLTELFLRDNTISDISAVAGLTNLTELSLGGNNISDISAVAGLTNLTYLSLRGNDISDISSVAGLTNLTELFLDGNSISDISSVVGLTNLTWLLLSDNSISDISSVAGLTNLTVLELGDNNISDLSSLVGNTGLGTGDTVDVRANPLNAVSINTHISTLQGRGVEVWFDAVVAQPVNIPDPNLRARIEMALGKASGATITTADMATLTTLDASGLDIMMDDGMGMADDIMMDDGMDMADNMDMVDDISDLTGLEYAINLTELFLSDNSISDISPVAGLTNLTGLWLDRNNISDISPVAGLTNLRELYLRSNSIIDISAVAGLTNLTFLQLWDNNISDISALAGLTNLTVLELSVNNISDLSAVSGLTNLTDLYLWDNNISDLSPLVGNTGLGTGDRVYVTGNPLNSLSINTHIPTLQGRGVTVEFDAQLSYTSMIPAGQSLFHVPLDVEGLDTVGDLKTMLGDAANFLLVHDRGTGSWNSDSDDVMITADLGITISMSAETRVTFTGDPWDGGTSMISLNAGQNLIGLPVSDPRVTNVSDIAGLFTPGVVASVILSTADGFVSVAAAGDPGDGPVRGDAAYLVTATADATAVLIGIGWSNEMTGAAPIALAGYSVDGQTAVLDVHGTVVDETTGLAREGFRVKVKNLSTKAALSSITFVELAAGGYNMTFVDLKASHAARVGDVLEISADLPSPLIGIKPIRYIVTVDDVKRSRIQLPPLVLYEIPSETKLLPNYPNPFNPETWIPYRLAEDAFVILTIYDQTGQVVRTLDVGHQVAAVYESRSKAIYWDGRNGLGEQVASGVYFYHLSAGDYSATRKMVILK